jgi:hypothetical protein
VPHRGLKTIALLAIALAALVAPGLARAEVRTVTITDPQDAPAPAAGAAKNPDLKSVDITYDTTVGSIGLVVKFYESISARKAETNVTVDLGAAPGASSSCAAGPRANPLNILLFAKQGVGVLTMDFWPDVLLAPSAVLSADGLTFTARFVSRPALGDLAYRCAAVSSVWMSEYKNPACNYYECDTVNIDLDPVNKNAWFDGFAPVPAPPTHVAVAGATASTLALEWQEEDKSVTGYEVLRDGQVVGTTDKTSYTVAGLSCGRSYALSVRADTPYTHSTEIPVSGTTAVCAPKAPAHVSVASTTRTSVTVAWGASAQATAYTVSVGTHTVQAHGSKVTVTGLHCGKSYAVTVRAVGPGGKSAAAHAVAHTKRC